MPKGKSAVPNRQAHTRISFLYQAANYFASLDTGSSSNSLVDANKPPQEPITSPPVYPIHDGLTNVASCRNKSSEQASESPTTTFITNDMRHRNPVSAHLASQILSISRKGQVKVSQTMKRTICKRCNVVLREGKTSTINLENHSRGGRKPWADVLLVTCLACGMEKRYPLGNQKKGRCKDQSREPDALDSSSVAVKQKDITQQ